MALRPDSPPSRVSHGLPAGGPLGVGFVSVTVAVVVSVTVSMVFLTVVVIVGTVVTTDNHRDGDAEAHRQGGDQDQSNRRTP